MTLFELKYPILQAPIGGMSSPTLAAAVSNAGGMGSLASTWTEPGTAFEQVTRLCKLTPNPFFVNFVLSFKPNALDAVLEAGAPAITFSWGQPGALIKRVHQAGARVGVQISTADGAKQALDDQADFIICQGIEAGGHVQSTTPLANLLAEVTQLAGDKPVIAAGGLTTGGDIARVIDQGAKGAMLGTRFVATLESNAHSLYKQALVESSSEDSVYTLCFDGGWPYAAHRVLRNQTLADWEAAGCPPSGQRPGEGDIIANLGERMVQRYSISSPARLMEGDVLACSLYAGTGCGKITDVPPVAELLASIWQEYEAVADSG